jgi:very-short-patch-repair endonuclease
MTLKLSQDSDFFLERCSEIIGNYENEIFNILKWCFVHENNINSPIEQILYFAFETLKEINRCSIEDIDIVPQVKIGGYRVDFFVKGKGVIIECDSQEFHDRTEKERRYEKVRDRFFQSNGYKVFHFTGKEIKDTPFEVAAEILSFLTKTKKEDLLNENFLGEY